MACGLLTCYDDEMQKIPKGRLIGVDYGEKRIGIALSDEGGNMAFPKAVIPCDNTVVPYFKSLVAGEGVVGIVIGESKDYKNVPNPLMSKIGVFKKTLEIELGLPTYLEPEFMTSAAAAQIQGEGAMLDASAATLILQSFLDKQKNK